MYVDEGRCTELRRAAGMVLVALLFAGIAFLAGCGSSGTILRTTRFLVVSDSGNNRVLIYNFPFSNGQSANVVLGQASFTTGATALTATGMNLPVNVAEDNSGNFYVSDLNNNRVLQFKPPFTNGMSASVVIGQPDFVTGAGNTSQNGLTQPGGLAFDSSGNLWVVDFANNRILQFKPPFSNGMNASLVLGQANFTSSAPGTTNSGLSQPHLIAFDASGSLWVTDTANNRALEFKPPFANGMAASLVIGQADFSSGSANAGGAVSGSGLAFPTGIAFDNSGDLWIADTSNERVLEFKPAFANGMSASLVLGQASFTTSTAGTTQSEFTGPFGIGFDTSGDLGVADSGNNRTLGFKPPFSNGQNASLVLGQADFTSSGAATTATGQGGPDAVLAAF